MIVSWNWTSKVSLYFPEPDPKISSLVVGGLLQLVIRVIPVRISGRIPVHQRVRSILRFCVLSKSGSYQDYFPVVAITFGAGFCWASPVLLEEEVIKAGLTEICLKTRHPVHFECYNPFLDLFYNNAFRFVQYFIESCVPIELPIFSSLQFSEWGYYFGLWKCVRKLVY